MPQRQRDILMQNIAMLNKHNQYLVDILNFHPRAAQMMERRENFITVADDETYFGHVYALIRTHQRKAGTWTEEDERIYQDTMKDKCACYVDAGGFMLQHNPECKVHKVPEHVGS